MFVSCVNWRKVSVLVGPHRSGVFLRKFFHLFSGVTPLSEIGHTLHVCHDLIIISLFPVQFVTFSFFPYTDFFTSSKYKNVCVIFCLFRKLLPLLSSSFFNRHYRLTAAERLILLYSHTKLGSATRMLREWKSLEQASPLFACTVRACVHPCAHACV